MNSNVKIVEPHQARKISNIKTMQRRLGKGRSLGVPIKAAKLKDVNNLLTKHYGADWMHLEELKYYKNVLTRDNNDVTNSDGESVVGPGNIENEEVLDFV
ncbi:hypothetical protein EVAR_29492_1 [Eumeta japonica]|uniref:Uncharacterized protein n=1 Tax=Eumeta variegata TaxID=151549 RepID=A0A4C1WSF2_EUMVA|nr:hypothetical protein EVAR_29492_1 [Eumeta japonica]